MRRFLLIGALVALRGADGQDKHTGTTACPGIDTAGPDTILIVDNGCMVAKKVVWSMRDKPGTSLDETVFAVGDETYTARDLLGVLRDHRSKSDTAYVRQPISPRATTALNGNVQFTAAPKKPSKDVVAEALRAAGDISVYGTGADGADRKLATISLGSGGTEMVLTKDTHPADVIIALLASAIRNEK